MYQDISGVHSVSVVRKSRSGNTFVVKMSDDTYRTFSTFTNSFVGDPYESLSDIKNVGGLLRVSDEHSQALLASVSVQPAEAVDQAEDITILADGGPTYQPPKAVIEEAQSAVDSLADSLSQHDLDMAGNLATGDPVGMDVVQWIYDYFTNNDPLDQIHGGFKGRKWAEKIISGEGEEDRTDYDPYARYKWPDDPDVDYMALGPDRDSLLVDRLVRIDWAGDAVYMWAGGQFVPMTESDIESFDYPYVCPIDPETAQVLAKWLDDNPYDLYDIRDTDPEVRNLFDTAYDEVDFEEIDRVSVVMADASGYAPAERSKNAKRQIRSFGGRFSGRQIEQGSKLKGFKKAQLGMEHPIDPAPHKTVKRWLSEQAPLTAAAPKQGRSQSIGQPAEDPTDHSQVSHDKTADWTGESAADEAKDEKETGLKDAIYFAIVDPNDSTAVLEMVAITRDSENQPEAWRRVKGQWKNDPATLAQLMSATPPPVVNIGDPVIVKSVLQQIDGSDAHPGNMPTDAVTDKAPPAIQASGWEESGLLCVEDVAGLKAVVSSFSLYGIEPEAEEKNYLRRRATAFNRMDIIPEAWRVPTAVERGMELASESPLFGDFGEVLVAAGHPFQGAKGAERLKAYWTHGEGAAKIRWGSRGDLTRAHRHLAKFVGPDRAWGLAERYHEAVFGMSNRKHDKLTGQWPDHGGKKK